MFEQSILAGANPRNRLWSTCLGIAGEALVVSFVVVAPMLWPQALPRAFASVGLYLPTVPPPAGHIPKPEITRVMPTRVAASPHAFTIPGRMPLHPLMVSDPPTEPVEGPVVAGGTGSEWNTGVPRSRCWRRS